MPFYNLMFISWVLIKPLPEYWVLLVLVSLLVFGWLIPTTRIEVLRLKLFSFLVESETFSGESASSYSSGLTSIFYELNGFSAEVMSIIFSKFCGGSSAESYSDYSFETSSGLIYFFFFFRCLTFLSLPLAQHFQIIETMTIKMTIPTVRTIFKSSPLK